MVQQRIAYNGLLDSDLIRSVCDIMNSCGYRDIAAILKENLEKNDIHFAITHKRRHSLDYEDCVFRVEYYGLNEKIGSKSGEFVRSICIEGTKHHINKHVKDLPDQMLKIVPLGYPEYLCAPFNIQK
jgi:hypothetical protein